MPKAVSSILLCWVENSLIKAAFFYFRIHGIIETLRGFSSQPFLEWKAFQPWEQRVEVSAKP
jgi:hypothetical protein